MNLLAEKQTYPQLALLDRTANYTAKFKSAFDNTQNGSEPPNSSTLRFKYLLATAPIIDPALVEPVKETPYTY